MLFEHPETKKMYTASEAAKEIGIHPSTLCNRRRKGETGKHLWRAGEHQLFKSTLPSSVFEGDVDLDLQKIPSETQYERELNNGLRNNSEGYIHSDFNRI